MAHSSGLPHTGEVWYGIVTYVYDKLEHLQILAMYLRICNQVVRFTLLVVLS